MELRHAHRRDSASSGKKQEAVFICGDLRHSQEWLGDIWEDLKGRPEVASSILSDLEKKQGMAKECDKNQALALKANDLEVPDLLYDVLSQLNGPTEVPFILMPWPAFVIKRSHREREDMAGAGFRSHSIAVAAVGARWDQIKVVKIWWFNYWSHGRSCPSSKGSDKQSGQSDTEGEQGSLELMEFDIDEPGKSKRSSYPYEISRQRNHDDTCDKNSSKSAEHDGGRSHSQRIVHEANSRNGQYHEGDGPVYDNGKADYDLDAVPPTKFHRHGSWDLLKDKEREISGTSRYTSREGRHYDRETWDREREEKIYRDMKREKEEEHRRRDKDWEREKEHHKERGKERERGHKYNEREQGERQRAGSRVRDRHLDREDNSGRDRRGYKIRDAESNRNSRYLKYDDHDGGSGDGERRCESKHRIHSEMDYHRSRGRERHDSEKDHGPRDDSRRGSESKLDRDEDNQEEYEERVELKLAEQEEEDLNRIKEESRRRREAILQKYEPQQLQQQGQP
ncbi:hypothetical protein Ancab_021041 [Ancistrocladus abbreviatus]